MINMRQNQLSNMFKRKYDTIHAGDEVKVLSYGQKVKCLNLGNEEAVVQMGIIKMKLPIEDLENEKKKKTYKNGNKTK